MHYATTTPVQATLPPNATIVLLIDPISTTCRIAQEISKRGHHLAAIWTKDYTGKEDDDAVDTTMEMREKRNPSKYGCPGLRYKMELHEGREFASSWDDRADRDAAREELLDDSSSKSASSSYPNEEEGSVKNVLNVVRDAARTRGLHIVGCFGGSGMTRASRLADAMAAQLGLPTCLAPPATYSMHDSIGGTGSGGSGSGSDSPTSAVATPPAAFLGAAGYNESVVLGGGGGGSHGRGSPILPIGMMDVRNKYTQQNLLHAAGLRSIRQVCGTSLKDPSVAHFLESEKYPIVIKPAYKSQGGIKLCRTKSEAEDHFSHLLINGSHSSSSSSATKSNQTNSSHNQHAHRNLVEVICQEYLRGTELVIDHVSRRSKHKTCMVWKYDKRSVNGIRAESAYFGTIPVDPRSHEASLVVPYVRHCLGALGVQNGPSHAEVILAADGGPVLVEMNVRAHGGDGSWAHLARALTGGYSQIEASVDAWLDPAAFRKLPDVPRSPFRAHGLQVHLVSYSEGTVLSTPGFEVLQRLPSFVSLSSSVSIGSKVEYTTDLTTSPGVCLLMNKDEAKLTKDVEWLRHLEEMNGLFTYKTRVESLARPTAMTFGLAAVRRGSDYERDNKGSSHRRVKSHLDHMVKPSLLRIQSNDRPELAMEGRMMKKRMTTVDASKEVVVVTDPYSTGCLVVNEMASRGYRVIALWTRGFSEEMKTHTPMAAGTMKYHGEVTESETLSDTIQSIYKAAGALRVVACIAGGEAGVDCADIVSERMNLRTNGTQVANRRDKKVQQELIRDAGMRSVRQAAGKKWEDVVEFLETEHYPVVLKPTDSAGSDGVKLCHNIEEAKEHFHHLFEVEAVNGGFNTEVLCQEFLRGKEYVIDQVSREGVHKTTMLWVYDKRPANNSAFVYFGMVPVDPNSMEAKILVPYARGVLDVLDVKNGPSHAEVILTPTGPCLVEMNVRAHGGDGNWRSLARGLTGGYSQVEVTVDSYLDKKQFAIIPNLPPSPFKASGQEIILVSFSRGQVIATPGYDVIRGMPSFVYMETGIKVGSWVERTVDLLTGIGSVILMHSDEQVLQKDIARIRQMEKDNELFEYEKSGAMFTAASQRHLSEIIVQEGDEF